MTRRGPGTHSGPGRVARDGLDEGAGQLGDRAAQVTMSIGHWPASGRATTADGPALSHRPGEAPQV
jgi:hypothetical protein